MTLHARGTTMVLRKVDDAVNTAGGAGMNSNQGYYNNPAESVARDAEWARMVLGEAAAD